MPAIYGPVLRPYGQEAVFNFVLYDRGGADFDANIIGAVGDTKITANEQTSVPTTNGFVGNDGGYALVLTATEMQFARAIVYIVDQSNPKLWIDSVFFIETYGADGAQHPSIGNALIPVPA